MVLVGLPFLLGNAAAHGFEDYVQSYAPCVNPVYDGTTYVCLGNGVATGPGAPGSSCPPGTQPQTSMYGGESFDVEVECIGDGGAMSTGMSCVTLCAAEAEAPPLAP